MTDRAILASYAHPDDEQGVTGALRTYLDQGVRVALVCATRGEVGEIADPALATPETLGAVREQELRRATAIVGFSDVYFLDYRDSGMVGTPPNNDPRAFINVDAHEAVGKLVKIIRTFKPTLLFTFDETGGYGHPDHLAINKWTTEAFTAAGDAAKYPDMGAPFAPSRLFYASIDRNMLKVASDYLAEQGIPGPFGGMDMSKMGMEPERITNRLDVSRYVDMKLKSLAEHKTQMAPDSPLRNMPEDLWRQWRSVETFALVAGVLLPENADMSDLFAGLPS